MKKKQCWIAALLAGVLLLTAGCGKSSDAANDQTAAPTVPATEPTESISAEASLNSLRQSMVGTPHLFAVAYFGYQEPEDPNIPVDPIEVLRESAPQLCADMPFLLEISGDRVIGHSGDLFCIVPLDADATVAVSKGYWEDENQQNIYDDILYSSDTGDPILLFCNNAGWEPDCQLYISGPSGDLFWYPQTDELEPIRQFMLKPDKAPEPTEMIGSWELAWTEVEGYQTDEEQGTRWIEIFSAASGDLLMSYGSIEFPDHNFYDERLTIDQRELHFGCGNREWTADLSYVGPFGTTYSFTLTGNDILIKQNYFLLDGAPSVSYEYFYRLEEYTESPYEYVLSQGGRKPELEELADTFWLSIDSYGLELKDDSESGKNGGSVALYDVDEIGAYTHSYSGSWSYEDGQLRLSLTPVGNGHLVDDSFPVLMLDGELWIFRSANGTGLPHFSTDMLIDILEQPKG